MIARSLISDEAAKQLRIPPPVDSSSDPNTSARASSLHRSISAAPYDEVQPVQSNPDIDHMAASHEMHEHDTMQLPPLPPLLQEVAHRELIRSLRSNIVYQSLRRPSSEQAFPKRLSHDERETNPEQAEAEVDHRLTAKRVSPEAHISPGSARSFGNLSFSSAVSANHFPVQDQELQMRNFRLPVWQVLPQWHADDSPIGRAYTDFHRIRLKSSTHFDTVEHRHLINATLLFRDRKPTDHLTSDNWASEFQSTFVEPITQTINIAGVYMLARLMRWLLNPTPETYAAVPQMIKPTLRQRMRSHPAQIDVIGMASVRDALLEDMRDFFAALMDAGLDVSWPHTVNEALIVIKPFEAQGLEIEEQVFVSPTFADHISNPENWSFGRKILDHFPELADCEIAISSEPRIRAVDRWL